MVNNNVLAALLIVAILISTVSLLTIIGKTSFTGAVTGTANVTVATVVAISLPVNSVNFGIMGVNEVNDTTDNSPPPFLIRNDGNVNVNVSINATPLWTSVSGTTSYYQFKCGNTSEWNCTPGSVNTFTNMPVNSPQVTAIANLSFAANQDEAELEIKLTVPPDETPGARGSVITFTATQA